MKAAVYDEFKGDIAIREVPTPDPKPHGVVVQVRATGLCLSDWHGWMGHDPDIKLPHVPGHELAGVVVAMGHEVNHFDIGDRVTVPFVCGCGSCDSCQSGNQQVCTQQTQPGFTHWGSFAEYVALDYAHTNLVKLPHAMDFETAATLGCRFGTAFRAVMDQAQIKPGQFLAVHGCGGVGLSAIMIGKALGARIIGVDIAENALALARELGCEHTLNAKAVSNIPEAIKELTNGGVHVSLDALGSKETCVNSIAGLRKQGKHIQIGLMAGADELPVIPIPDIIADELEIIGSHGIQAHRYTTIFNMILEGKFNPARLIGERISLEKIPSAIPAMKEAERSGVTIVDSF